VPILRDPSITTGETYEITFGSDDDGPFWNLATTGSPVRTVLEKNHGNRTLTARELGISRNTLWRKIKRYNIEVGVGPS